MESSKVPIYKLFRATKQVVPVDACCWADGRPVKIQVDAVLLSKNFGPFYHSPAVDSTIRSKEGKIYLTLDEKDTDEPGFLNVQVFSRVTFLNFWFSVNDKTAQETMDAADGRLPGN